MVLYPLYSLNPFIKITIINQHLLKLEIWHIHLLHLGTV